MMKSKESALIKRVFGGVDYEMKDILDVVFRMGSNIQTRNSECRRLINHCVVFHTTPLLSLRKTAWKNALREWEWFMSGSNLLSDLHPAVRSWWEPWGVPASSGGMFVPFNYSHQFRQWRNSFDQIAFLIEGIKNHPYSRRNVITTWDTRDMFQASQDKKGITNCHGTVVQAFVEPANNKLTLVTYQRSVDIVCGLPHNWIQYWAFLLWLAHLTERSVGELHWIGGDCHLYAEHKPIAFRMLECGLDKIKTPNLVYIPTTKQFRADDFTLDSDYSPLIIENVPMIV